MGDPKNPLPFRFGELTYDDFDRLSYLVAHLDDPRVLKMRAPDGGLDTVRPRDAKPDEAAWGIQAKRFTAQISWSNCKESLDRAVAQWGKPDRVTFAFPRDLTNNQHKLFVRHLVDRHPGVDVDWWGQTKLTAALNSSAAGAAIAKEFFHREDPADVVDRALRAGGPLKTGEDVLARHEATGDFLQTSNPHFRFTTAAGQRGDEVAAVPGSAMRMQFARGGQQLTVDAVPKADTALEHHGPKGRFAFSDPDRAIGLIKAVQTHGGRADLGEATISFERVPPPFDELVKEVNGVVTVRAELDAEPWATRLKVETDLGTEELDFDLSPGPRQAEWDAVLVGHRFGIRLEMRFVWQHDRDAGLIEINWQFTRATGSARDRARSLGLIVALHGTGTFALYDRDEVREPLHEATVPQPVPADLRGLRDVYQNLAEIQEFAGRTFGPPPDEFSGEESFNLAYLADQLRRGETSASISDATFVITAAGARDFQPGGADLTLKEELYAAFFGREVHVGQRISHLPKMRIGQWIRRRDGDWDVKLVPVSPSAAKVTVEYLKHDEPYPGNHT